MASHLRTRFPLALLSIIVLLGVVTSSQPAHPSTLAPTSWTQFHFDPAKTGVNPFETILSPATVPGLQLAWRVRAPGNTITTSPVVDAGSVFLGSLGTSGDAWVFARSASTGRKLWSEQTSTRGFQVVGLAAGGGRLYVTSSDSNLMALEETNGQVDWSGDEGQAELTVADGVIYDSSNEVKAIAASNGGGIWSLAAPVDTEAAPALAGGRVFWGGGIVIDVVALDATSGLTLWKRRTGMGMMGAPAVANGIVYIGGSDGTVYAIDAASGAVAWTWVCSAPVLSSPAVDDGIVFIGCDDHDVYALDAATGTVVWSFATGRALGFASPAVANGVVYIGGLDGVIRALDEADGALLWSYPTGGAIDSSPVVVNGSVYVGSRDGFLYAFGL